MELKLISMTYTETLDMGLQVAWDTVLFVYNTVRGQASGFIEHGTSNYCDWTSLVSTFIVIGYDVKGDDGVLGEDNLTSIKFLEGEHIMVGVGFDHGGRHRNYLEIA
tara:strand:+ start:28 stop:348 length:321 start_codon:yes stop_codon:yes gene_type:complete